MRISDWSSDVCSSDLTGRGACEPPGQAGRPDPQGTRYRAAGAGARRELSPGRSSHTERHEHGRLPGVTAGPIVRHRSVLLASDHRSEEHTSELQSLMRISYAVFCLKKKT